MEAEGAALPEIDPVQLAIGKQHIVELSALQYCHAQATVGETAVNEARAAEYYFRQVEVFKGTLLKTVAEPLLRFVRNLIKYLVAKIHL